MTIRQIVERWVNHIPRNRIFNSEKETLISSLEEFVKKEIDDFEYASCEPTGLKKRLIGTEAESCKHMHKEVVAKENFGLLGNNLVDFDVVCLDCKQTVKSVGSGAEQEKEWIMYALFDFDKPYEIASAKKLLIRQRDIAIKRGWKKENMPIKKVSVTEYEQPPTEAKKTGQVK